MQTDMLQVFRWIVQELKVVVYCRRVFVAESRNVCVGNLKLSRFPIMDKFREIESVVSLEIIPCRVVGKEEEIVR